MIDGRNWTNFRTLKIWVKDNWGMDFINDNVFFRGESNGRPFYAAGIVDKTAKAL